MAKHRKVPIRAPESTYWRTRKVPICEIRLSVAVRGGLKVMPDGANQFHE